jgi:hypothetical protein
MTSLLLALAALLLALQTAPVPEASAAQAKPTDFADLPVEEATAPRCGVAFATAQNWQNAGDARANGLPDIASTRAREFFVQSMVRLIDAYSLERGDVTRLVEREAARHEADGGATIQAMLPACLALLEMSSQSAE